MAKGKAVRDVKADTLAPSRAAEPSNDNKVQVVAGNTAVLTVQLLNLMLKELQAIKTLLDKHDG